MNCKQRYKKHINLQQKVLEVTNRKIVVQSPVPLNFSSNLVQSDSYPHTHTLNCY